MNDTLTINIEDILASVNDDKLLHECAATIDYSSGAS